MAGLGGGGGNGGKGAWVWLTLDYHESIVLQAILEACLEADGNPDMIVPLLSKLKQAQARQQLQKLRGGKKETDDV